MNHLPRHMAASAADLEPAGERFFFLPGSPGRARRIAEAFEESRVIPSERGHDVHVGYLRDAEDGDRRVPVGSVASGMGCPSLGIIVAELVALGVRSILRVGTAGSLQPGVETGSVVIATGAVRDEGASLAYAPPEFPAIASPRMVEALASAGSDPQRGPHHLGLVHSKDSLHGREFGWGPLAEENEAYMQRLTRLGVVASEMEASHLFVLAATLLRGEGVVPSGPDDRIHAGCALGILAHEGPPAPDELRRLAVERAIETSLEAARRFTRASGAA